MHRLRLKFSRGDKLKYLSHLDLMRLWERALRRAGLSIAYSEGFSPHPRISLASPLAVGITSSAELMDIFLARHVATGVFLQQLEPQLPDGIDIIEVTPVQLDLPSLQSQVRHAEYEVVLETGRQAGDIRPSISSLLASHEFPWHHARDTGERHYDLRPLIDDIWLIGCRDGMCRLGMRLKCDPSGSGRPEQVAKALGFAGAPRSIERTKLILA
jgi:radical SAM-linked protein